MAGRWGQVFILDALSKYKSKDARDAENIVERITPRLQHANCAVVLSAVKVQSESSYVCRSDVLLLMQALCSFNSSGRILLLVLSFEGAVE